MTAQPFTRARLQLLGHQDLGVVSCRRLSCGSIELEDGRTFGPGAVYCYTPVKTQAPISATEMTLALLALDGATSSDTEVDGPHRWRVQLPGQWGECHGATFLEAYADAVHEMRERLEEELGDELTETDRNRLLRAMGATDRDSGEDGPGRWWVTSHWGGSHMGATFVEAYAKMAKASMDRAEEANEELCTDERARRAEALLQAMERIEEDGVPASVQFTESWFYGAPGTAIRGSLEQVVSAILNRPVEVEYEEASPAEPSAAPPPATPATTEEFSDDDIPF